MWKLEREIGLLPPPPNSTFHSPTFLHFPYSPNAPLRTWDIPEPLVECALPRSSGNPPASPSTFSSRKNRKIKKGEENELRILSKSRFSDGIEQRVGSGEVGKKGKLPARLESNLRGRTF